MKTSGHTFLDKDFNMTNEHYAIIASYKCGGYCVAPNWMPIGRPSYDWIYVNGITAMMKPAPKFLHTLRFRFGPRRLVYLLGARCMAFRIIYHALTSRWRWGLFTFMSDMKTINNKHDSKDDE